MSDRLHTSRPSPLAGGCPPPASIEGSPSPGAAGIDSPPLAGDTTLRFGDFELDVASRSVMLGGTRIGMQPRVFELLAYLVRHAGRVVPKDELMDALWPNVHVTEASLQRAVSLARRALAEGGLERAIRNYVRLGYRFAVDEPRLSIVDASQPTPDSLLGEARLRVMERDWSTAADLFARADRGQNLGADDLDVWAQCLECAGRAPEAGHVLALAVERHQGSGACCSAAKSASVLARIHLERGELVVARAWLERAAGLLPNGGGCPARPHILWMRSRLAAFEGSPEEAVQLAAEAVAEADAYGAEALKALSLAYLGFYNISLGRVEEGSGQQDLAAAIALSSRVDPITGGLIYCNILWSCRNFADWERARQWSAGFETWCTAAYAQSSGACDLHRAEITGVQRNLGEALACIDTALAKLPAEEAWSLGEGYRIRGDVNAMIGNLDAARADYASAYAQGWDAEPGNAVLLFEAGDPEAALAALDRALSGNTWFHLQRALWLKANKALIAAASGHSELAKEVLEELRIECSASPKALPSIRAMAAEASSALIERNDPEVARLLVLARQLWTAAGFEFHAARVRLELADRLLELGDSSGARLEVFAATRTAQRLGSRRLIEAAQTIRA